MNRKQIAIKRSPVPANIQEVIRNLQRMEDFARSTRQSPENLGQVYRDARRVLELNLSGVAYALTNREIAALHEFPPTLDIKISTGSSNWDNGAFSDVFFDYQTFGQQRPQFVIRNEVTLDTSGSNPQFVQKSVLERPDDAVLDPRFSPILYDALNEKL